MRFTSPPESFQKKSPLRIESICPHFDQCPSCHYLHTDYQEELRFKKSTLERSLKSEVTIHPAKNRLNYRNRIQLHYDLKKEKIGYLEPNGHNIIEVPFCMIGTDLISNKLKSLYENKSWKNLIKDHPNKGHIELYEKENKCEISINSPYAFGGFTQVNQIMNEELLKLIIGKINDYHLTHESLILDLFGGSGNLTKKINRGSILVVDSFPPQKNIFEPNQSFLQIDLFKPDFMDLFPHFLKTKIIDLLILDPPRSGFKGLNLLVENYLINYIIYVSCNPATLARDLNSIVDNFKIEEIHLLDFFPSTFHFESLVFLKSRKS